MFGADIFICVFDQIHVANKISKIEISVPIIGPEVAVKNFTNAVSVYDQVLKNQALVDGITWLLSTRH